MESDENEAQTKRILADCDKQVAKIETVSQQAVERLITMSDAAHREYHRFAIGGAAGGIAILASQFPSLNSASQSAAAIGILLFLHSLRCSLMTFQSMWIERAMEAGHWARWAQDAVAQIYEARKSNLYGAVQWPEPPNQETAGYIRWSSAAIGSLTGGGAVSAFALVLSLNIDLPMWLINLPHRVSHLLGWV